MQTETIPEMSTNNKGFTLLETIIFVFLISLIIVAIAQSTTIAIRNNISNANKILATHYAEEVREWVRGKKEESWSVLLSKASGGGITYCFNSETIIDWPQTGTCGSNYSLFGMFRRDVILQTFTGPDSTTQVRMTVNMQWKEGKNTFSQSTSTIFAPFE